jgi:hypothetical protein
MEISSTVSCRPRDRIVLNFCSVLYVVYSWLVSGVKLDISRWGKSRLKVLGECNQQVCIKSVN